MYEEPTYRKRLERLRARGEGDGVDDMDGIIDSVGMSLNNFGRW